MKRREFVKTVGAVSASGLLAGCDPKTASPCHSTTMVVDEDMMARGVALHCALAERFLARGFD